jgi:hypothetical protein
MMADYLSGGPYMRFAIRAGLAPPGATEATHRETRDLCKIDAFWILAPLEELETTITRMTEIMTEASRLVTGGMPLKVKVEVVVRWPALPWRCPGP